MNLHTITSTGLVVLACWTIAGCDRQGAPKEATPQSASSASAVVPAPRVVRAAPSPFAFKGLPFGTATPKQVNAAIPALRCSQTVCRAFEKYAPFGSLTYAGVAAQSIAIDFIDGTMENVYVTFDPDKFQAIIETLSGVYGEPTARTTTEYKTRGGATAEQVVASWVFDPPVGAILLSRFGDSIDHGTLSIITTKALDHGSKDAAERKLKAKKDI